MLVGSLGPPRLLICLKFRARNARNLSFFPFFPFSVGCFSQFLAHPERDESKIFECAFGNPTIVMQSASGLFGADRGHFEAHKGRAETVLPERP